MTTGGSGPTRNFSLIGEDAAGDGEKELGIQSRIASASLWVRAIFVVSGLFDDEEENIFGGILKVCIKWQIKSLAP